MINYKKLLKLYMQLVVEYEGVDFLDDYDYKYSYARKIMTEEQFKFLQKIAKEK